MIQDLQDGTWIEKSTKNGFKFSAGSVAVALPNGDCLITGGMGDETWQEVY